jgi:hypothetical protein
MNCSKTFNLSLIISCIRHRVLMTILILIALLDNNTQAQPATQAIIGRWNLTLDIDSKKVPSWLEVKLSGVKTLVGQFVGSSGSARPISQVHVADGKISFRIPPQWERAEQDMVFEGTLENDKLTGTIISSSGKSSPFIGVRAPLLQRESLVVWGEPIDLLKSKNLNAWYADRSVNQWILEDGILKSLKSGANLITTQKFDDFKLHIEFRYPAGSNSGIYLRGRYEVQIEDNKGREPSSLYFGGIYGFLTPNEMVAKAPGEWQSYDIILVGRLVTIIANGKTIICDQLIPGITGGALDSNEGEPGPIMLQGDHGPIDFRNIIITPTK